MYIRQIIDAYKDMKRERSIKDFKERFEGELLPFIEKKLNKPDVELYLDYRQRSNKRYNTRDDRKLKKRYGWFVLILLSFWIVFVAVIIFLSAFSILILSDYVLTVLLTTATLNILALPTIILKYLFSKNKNHE